MVGISKKYNVVLVMGLEPVLVPPIVEFATILHQEGFEVRVVYTAVKGLSIDYALPFAQNTCVTNSADKSLIKKLQIPVMLRQELRQQIDLNTKAVCCFDPVSLQALKIRGKIRPVVVYWQFELYRKENTRLFSMDYWRLLNLKRWVYQKVDVLVAPSKSRLQKIADALHLPPGISRIVVFNTRHIPLSQRFQGVEESFGETLTELRAWVNRYKCVGIYSGNITEVAYLAELIDAYRAMPDNALIFAGTVALSFKEHFHEQVPMIPNIRFLGALSLDKLEAVLRLCDIGFCFYDSKIGGELADPAPNKVGDYIATGMWVISSGQQYMKDVIPDHELGFALDDVTPVSILESVRLLQARADFKSRTHIKKYFYSSFNMGAQAAPLLDVIKQLQSAVS